MMAVRDTNKNMTYKVAAASTEPPTKYVSPQPSVQNLQPCQKTPLLPDLIAATNPVTASTSIQSSSSFIEEETHQSLAKFDDIDDILETLAQLEYNPSTHSQLDLTKSAYGCDWSSSSSTCVHGISCPFITQFLGLADFQESQAKVPPAAPPRVHRVVVLRQTQ